MRSMRPADLRWSPECIRSGLAHRRVRVREKRRDDGFGDAGISDVDCKEHVYGLEAVRMPMIAQYGDKRWVGLQAGLSESQPTGFLKVGLPPLVQTGERFSVPQEGWHETPDSKVELLLLPLSRHGSKDPRAVVCYKVPKCCASLGGVVSLKLSCPGNKVATLVERYWGLSQEGDASRNSDADRQGNERSRPLFVRSPHARFHVNQRC